MRLKHCLNSCGVRSQDGSTVRPALKAGRMNGFGQSSWIRSRRIAVQIALVLMGQDCRVSGELLVCSDSLLDWRPSSCPSSRVRFSGLFGCWASAPEESKSGVIAFSFMASLVMDLIACEEMVV